MERVRNFARAAWHFLGEDRTMLVVMGVAIATLPMDWDDGSGLMVILDLAMIAIGVSAWRSLGRQLRAGGMNDAS